MSSITSGIGIFSGINSADIISKLLSLEAKPRTLAQNRLDQQTSIKASLLGISAKLVSLQGTAAAFRSSDVLNARTVQVSDPLSINVTASASAAIGSTQFRAIRQAQSQRVVSNGFANVDTTPVGAGTITIKQGGFVNVDTSLDTLNGGSGVSLGSIRVTARSGAQTIVDLSATKTINDVIRAINNTAGVGVVASTSGDRVVLTDSTGQTSTAISVAEVDGGTTAAGLGLTAGTFSGSALTGSDVISVTGSTKLGQINDGNGFHNASGDDFKVTLKSGATVSVDIANQTTLQGVVDAINNDSENSGDLVASIDPSGNGLRLTDSSVGGGTLSVSALNGSHAAKDLGILGNEQGGGVLVGQRVLAGFNSVLLRNLNGGSGITTLGTAQLTDRSGATATVDFSSAGSLSDIVSTINSAGLGIKAALNTAGTGIKLTDTTGSTTSNLIVADVSGTVANDLHLTNNAATTTVNSGDLNLRYITEATRLDTLNGGKGVQKGQFRITDSVGGTAIVDLTSTSIKTVGDVITAINSSGTRVLASVNSTGDGILITDTGGGGAKLAIEERGGRIATDLKILGTATNTSIDGAYRTSITVSATDTVNDVVTKINAAKPPVSVSVTNDGTSITPFRVALASKFTGNAGRLAFDPGTTGFSFSTVAEGTDALLQVGAGGNGSVPLVYTSSTNTFNQVLNGVNVSILSATNKPITTTISQDDQSLVNAVQSFVNSFNGTLDTLANQTSFNSTTNDKGTLFADPLAQQIESGLYRLASQSFGSGNITQLAQLGIGVKGGRLTFDQTKFSSQLENNAQAVQDFLKTSSTGFADVFEKQIKAYTETFTGQIAQRVQFIDNDSTDIKAQIDRFTARLAVRRTVLEAQFLAMEQAIGALQTQTNTLTQLANLAGLSTTSSNTKK
jgi:flagellar hook-associated protein 2